jgi:hypothetical protein
MNSIVLGIALPLLALLLGGLVIAYLRKRFKKMRTGEAIAIFVLYAVLVTLFTGPVVNFLKELLDKGF